MEQHSLVGKQLGAYVIQAKIGEGGMAQVYKGYHTRLRRDVAIKVILPQIADQAGFRERFEREAQVVASLTHPNIVTVYDFGEVDNITYLVMQYVGGGTLRDMLRRSGRLDPQQAVHYTIQIARALHHAHQRCIVHRDIKPQNMLISASDPNTLLLSDFGIAKLFDSSASAEMLPTSLPGGISSDSSLTNAGQLVGTIEYMAPEQIQHQPVDARADIYSLGIVLFQMLAGRLPFEATTAQGMLFQHVYTAPTPVREIVPGIPVALEQVITRALAKAPVQRYQTAEEMVASLETIFAPMPQHMQASNYDPVIGDEYTAISQNRVAPSQYGNQQPVFPISQAYPATVTGQGGSISVIPQPPGRRTFPISTIIGGAVVLLIVGIIVISRILPSLTSSSPPGQTSTGQTTATPFHETFVDNSRNWTVGSSADNNLTASAPSHNQYILQVGSTATTYFPNPSGVGALPANFTLSAQMMQTQGATDVSYGIAFRLKQSGSNVYAYAFVIDSSENYQVLKYDTAVSTTPTKLWGGSQLAAVHPGLNQGNLLQVIVRGNRFSFIVNGTPVQVGANKATSLTDSSYTGGEPGLLVAGPGTSFTVTSVQLTLP